MKHTFSRSFATRLSIYVLSFTLIVFTTIMVLAYNYSRGEGHQLCYRTNPRIVE